MKRAAIVSPIRTAVGKFQGGLSSLTAGELGAEVLKALVERTKIDPERIDDVIFAQGYGSGEAPCIADFSAYHPLWYTRRIESLKEILDLTPAVLDWMDRMAAIGHADRGAAHQVVIAVFNHEIGQT